MKSEALRLLLVIESHLLDQDPECFAAVDQQSDKRGDQK